MMLRILFFILGFNLVCFAGECPEISGQYKHCGLVPSHQEHLVGGDADPLLTLVSDVYFFAKVDETIFWTATSGDLTLEQVLTLDGKTIETSKPFGEFTEVTRQTSSCENGKIFYRVHVAYEREGVLEYYFATNSQFFLDKKGRLVHRYENENYGDPKHIYELCDKLQ
ncbi:MAG: hypothetical protein AB7F43_13655 [Bacteriovoracia bacterium]